MEGAVEIRSGVRDHLDFPDLEFGSRGVTRAGRFAAEVIANDRRGEPFVSDHAVLDGVA